MVNLSCIFCGKQFRVLPYRAKIAKFCSRSCLAKAQLPSIQIPRLAALRGKRPHNFANIQSICHCCAQPFYLPPSRIGIKKYCSQKCYSKAQRLNDVTRYRRITVNGKRILEHRFIMEQQLGRPLTPWEHVDHINRNKRDNRPENLRVLDLYSHGAISSSQRGIPITLTLDGLFPPSVEQ